MESRSYTESDLIKLLAEMNITPIEGIGKLLQQHPSLTATLKTLSHFAPDNPLVTACHALVTDDIMQLNYQNLRKAITWLRTKYDYADDAPLIKSLTATAIAIHFSSEHNMSSGDYTLRLPICYLHFAGANLFNANLLNNNFSYAILKKAILKNTYLNNTDFTHADMQGAQLQNANNNDKPTIFHEANLTHANLEKVHFSHANFSKAILRGAYIREAQLKQVDFTDADLSYTDFSDSDLSQANFTGADLTSATFDRTTLTGAKFFEIELAILADEEKLTKILDRLYNMICHHPNIAALRAAIAVDLKLHIDRIFTSEQAIAYNVAYRHPLLSQHRDLKVPRAVVNTVFGWFAPKTADGRVARSLIETRSQEKLLGMV